MKVEAKVGMAGFKRAIVLKAKDRSVVHDTGWSKNLITNLGLDEFALGAFNRGNCCVGTSNTPPTFTDTALVSQVAATNTKVSGGFSSGINTVAGSRYAWSVEGWEFSEGVFSGDNLAEIGFARYSGGNGLCSRSLFLDGSGNPTTFTVQSDEILQVFYEFRLYIPENDVVGSIVDSTTGVSHSYILRAANCEQTQHWSSSNYAGNNAGYITLHGGDIGDITSHPTSSIGLSHTYTASPYTNGTHYRDYLWSLSLGQGNAAGGIRSMMPTMMRYGAYGNFQCQFDPPIDKDNTKKLTVSFRLSWGRAAI